jgi:hypothetical protein
MNKKKPIDILQGKFHYFKGDVELDDENEDLTDLEKRVYSGETIVGDKKKMYWTEDGWKEGEKKQNTNPFRIKKVGDKYEYDFVSYDEWEKIMTNEDENCEDDYEMDENYKVIKLKDLITEDIDRRIKKSIDELGELTEEIERVKKEILKPMETKYKQISTEALPLIEKLKVEMITTKKYVFKIMKKKHYRSSVSYRELFSTALTKVNRHTKILLNNLKDDLTKMTLIGSRYSISPIEIKEGSFTAWVKKYARKVVRKVYQKLKSVVSANRELRKLV